MKRTEQPSSQQSKIQLYGLFWTVCMGRNTTKYNSANLCIRWHCKKSLWYLAPNHLNVKNVTPLTPSDQANGKDDPMTKTMTKTKNVRQVSKNKNFHQISKLCSIEFCRANIFPYSFEAKTLMHSLWAALSTVVFGKHLFCQAERFVIIYLNYSKVRGVRVIFGKHLFCHAWSSWLLCWALLTFPLSHIIATPIFHTRGQKVKQGRLGMWVYSSRVSLGEFFFPVASILKHWSRMSAVLLWHLAEWKAEGFRYATRIKSGAL